MKKYIIYLFGLIIATNILAQSETSYKAETFGSLSTGDNTPFWMLHHNWGTVPLDANNFYIRGSVFHKQVLNKDWSLDAGFDLAGSSPHSFGSVWIQQIYGELNWKAGRLSLGAKEDYTSLLNPYLSSGDFVSSNNARPIPEAKISIPEFIAIPYTNENVYVKADFSVGRYFDGKYQEDMAKPHNTNYTTGVLSHHKSIYFRFGNIEENNRFQVAIGLDHRAQWGGTLYKRVGSEYNIIKQPKGLDDFFKVVFAREGSEKASDADKAFVAGSHIGAYTLKSDYKLRNDDKLSFYWQHFFEDGSGMALKNFKDMLLGLEYKTNRKQLISGAVFEYVFTKNQSGPIHFNTEMDEEHRHNQSKGTGNDNYYNNVDYIQGPSNYGRTHGTALFLSPEYNKDGRLNFKSSRIFALHLGIEGYILPYLKYRALGTAGKSWGRYYAPFKYVKKGLAGNLDLIYSYPKVEGLDFKLSLGFNTGKFFNDDTFGAGITITKRGIISAL